MSNTKTAVLTLLAMLAFAGNSILCRLALGQHGIDAASFTSIRLLSGAVVLGVISRCWRGDREGQGHWFSGLALFAYAAAFSWAYQSLTAATGALLLFGAVQVTMIGHGLWSGERLSIRQVGGLTLALAGLVGLLRPGLSAPPLLGSGLMLLAGLAWGVYSIRGKGAGDPTRMTAGNFRWAALFTLLLSAATLPGYSLDGGVGYAVASGAVTSGLGYALWYAVVPELKATQAATVQLSVPVLAALGGIVILGESLSFRFALASLAVLGGIALVMVRQQCRDAKEPITPVETPAIKP